MIFGVFVLTLAIIIHRLYAHFMRWLFLTLTVFLHLCSPLQPSLQAEEHWSSKLLNDVLQEAPKPLQGEKPEGQLLRSYQFRHVRVGEPGRAKTALGLLSRLLPAGSSLKVDVPANCIHLLSTSSAHAAAWDFISAIDIPEPPAAGPREPSPPSEELRDALRRLSEPSPVSNKILQAFESLQRDVSGIALSSASQRRQLLLLLSVFILFMLLMVVVLLRRKSGKTDTAAPACPAPSTASLLAPENLGAALEPMQRRMQQEMLSALNATAIRMESWYNEQKAQQEQLVQLAGSRDARLTELGERLIADNRQLIESASSRFDASASRIEEGVHNLSAQNDRVGAIAGELATAVRELDSTKDNLLSLQEQLAGKSSQLDGARLALTEREGEITRQQAKLAALTLILEEGAGLPELRFETRSATTQPTRLSNPCTTMPLAATVTLPTKRYQFLPPDFREPLS